MSVDFPQPFGPIMPILSPRMISGVKAGYNGEVPVGVGEGF